MVEKNWLRVRLYKTCATPMMSDCLATYKSTLCSKFNKTITLPLVFPFKPVFFNPHTVKGIIYHLTYTVTAPLQSPPHFPNHHPKRKKEMLQSVLISIHIWHSFTICTVPRWLRFRPEMHIWHSLSIGFPKIKISP